MNISSKEFKEKYKDLFKRGYCKYCIAGMVSPYTINILCEECNKIRIKETKEYFKKIGYDYENNKYRTNNHIGEQNEITKKPI